PGGDASGVSIRAPLAEARHRVLSYTILPDDPGGLRAHLEELFGVPGLDAVIVNGGTGLAPRDTTYEAIAGLLEKRLDGFGELFRMLSYQQVGSAAMLSRAVAGVARGKIVVSLPGAPAAVELAMQKLLLPELGHLVHLVCGYPMRVRLRFFAALRERMGARAERSVEPGTTVGALWRALVAERPELAATRVRVAVNETYVEPSHRLADGDEVAFFPPVSGGA